jgi:4'-phosphopantetheinyl transferase
MNATRLAYVDPDTLAAPDIAARHLVLLDSDEQRKYSRYLFDEHRREYLAGCALAKKLIAETLGADARDIRFRRDRWGKPHVEGLHRENPLRFSISHTKGLAACAVSSRAEIGLDVERIDRPAEQLPISLDCVSPAELADLRRHEGGALSRRFAQYWTLKEAYGKAVGKGLGIGFGRLCFRFDEGTDTDVIFDGLAEEPGPWRFRMLGFGDTHVVAVAIRSTHLPAITLSRWVPERDTFVYEPARFMAASR